MKLDITQLRKMILEEAQKLSQSGRENLQEVFRSAGGIGFGDMKPLVQDAPHQPSLTPPRPRIIQNDFSHHPTIFFTSSNLIKTKKFKKSFDDVSIFFCSAF